MKPLKEDPVPVSPLLARETCGWAPPRRGMFLSGPLVTIVCLLPLSPPLPSPISHLPSPISSPISPPLILFLCVLTHYFSGETCEDVLRFLESTNPPSSLPPPSLLPPSFLPPSFLPPSSSSLLLPPSSLLPKFSKPQNSSSCHSCTFLYVAKLKKFNKQYKKMNMLLQLLGDNANLQLNFQHLFVTLPFGLSKHQSFVDFD